MSKTTNSSAWKPEKVTAGQVWFATVICFTAWAFGVYDFVLFGTLLPEVGKQMQWGLATQAEIATWVAVGTVVIALAVGPFVDRFGRRAGVMLTVGGAGICSALTALVGTIGVLPLILIRSISGLGYGEQGVNGAYLSELYSAADDDFIVRWRGRIYSVVQGGWPVGALLAALLTSLLLPSIGWQGCFLFAAVPSIIVAVLARRLRETPQFETLSRKGHAAREAGGGLVKLFAGPSRRPALVLGGAHLLNWFTVQVFAILGTTVLVNVHHITFTNSLLVLVLSNIWGFIGYLVHGYFGDKFGRRNVIAVGWSACGLAFAAMLFVPSSFWTVVALYRLAQNSDAKILVLEAGGPDAAPEIHAPQDWPQTLGLPFVHHFKTTPQTALNGRSIDWPRANVLGGCSSVNAMIFCRGHHTDYDSWAYEGNAGWDYASVLPDYKALEDFAGGASAYRGTGGPLHVTQPDPAQGHPGAAAFIEGAVSLGYPQVADFNGPKLEGPAWVNFTIYDGKRQSTAVAFLKPAMETRPNLTVLTKAPAVKLLIENGACVGVEYLHAGRPVKVMASKEVIVSAGAVASPWLLMLSGIGPAEQLRRHGIPVVVNLPGVGQNLQDHPLGAGANWQAKAPVPPSNYNESEVYMWSKSDSGLPGPDINTLYVSLPFATPQLPIKAPNVYSILSGVVRPHSRGSITLASSDPRVDPIIDPNYLGTDQDFKAYKASIDLARAIGNSAAYDGIRQAEILPGDQANDPASYRNFLRNSVWTFFHPTSTCRMGVDAMSVVDPQLRVYGVQNLRVADASIMPSITTGNTNAPSILIGWRAAGMLIGQV